MKYIVPQILKNKLAFVEAEIIEELKKLIAKMQELDLKETGYKFHVESGDEVIIREVLIEEDGTLSGWGPSTNARLWRDVGRIGSPRWSVQRGHGLLQLSVRWICGGKL